MPVALLALVLAGGTVVAAQEATPATGTSVPVQVEARAPQSATPAAPPAAPAISVRPDDAVPLKTDRSPAAASTENLRSWSGLPVAAIRFVGVTADALTPLPEELDQKVDQPLDPAKIRSSLRRLFATGLYRDCQVDGYVTDGKVTLIFRGTATLFVGRVYVYGVKDDQLTTQLQRAAKLNAGSPYTPARLTQASALLEETLASNGYHQSTVSPSIKVDDENSQVTVSFTVKPGKQARIGAVTVTGDSGLALDQFRKKGKLKAKRKVDRDTVSRALTRLRKTYQKKGHLEASLNLQKQEFQAVPNVMDYEFQAQQGPIVTVKVEGFKVAKSQIQKLVPIYDEGTIDNDLLNEGSRNLRDYLQRKGYFDASFTYELLHPDPAHEQVVYHATPGVRHKVSAITIAGNKYFDQQTIRERLSVQQADVYERNGRFSQALLATDAAAITALYQANGFNQVKVTPVATDSEGAAAGTSKARYGRIAVTYTIDEGPQRRFGRVELTGVKNLALSELTSQMNTTSGQPYSLANLSGDRDLLLTYYLSHGFSQVTLAVEQTPDPADANLINIDLHFNEGEQFFVRNVLTSGLRYTRPEVVASRIQVHPGDPLDRSALLDTQRQLYNLTLFNEVDTAIQNPAGAEQDKNVLLNLTEAKRWDIQYGFGFEVQTGTPQSNCKNLGGLSTCGSNGNVGASPKVLFDLTRINFRGRDQTITLQTAYGSLEKRATAIFQNPNWFGKPNLSFSVSGGYTNSQDLSTYAASRIEGSVRVTDKINKAYTIIPYFSYRRVAVNSSSLQVSPNQIPLLSQPARVGGPGFTFFRDTRQPLALDATNGNYLSVQEFLSNSGVGSQANFNRVDVTQSSYHRFGGKRKYVFARSTRFGFEQVFGSTVVSLPANVACSGFVTPGTTNTIVCPPFIPLPERLYAGGATSHRGFGINSAGPRDLQTGYPVGGSGAFVNSLELRLPPPTLPFFGDGLSFVAFHDMGNVFDTTSHIWPSFLRYHQPDVSTCRNVKLPAGQTEGVCNFNYFSHALGLGLRYKTPLGPIRVDFSDNLNPTIYPILNDYTGKPPRVGNSGHFNFFFSIGQSF